MFLTTPDFVPHKLQRHQEVLILIVDQGNNERGINEDSIWHSHPLNYTSSL